MAAASIVRRLLLLLLLLCGPHMHAADPTVCFLWLRNHNSTVGLSMQFIFPEPIRDRARCAVFLTACAVLQPPSDLATLATSRVFHLL